MIDRAYIVYIGLIDLVFVCIHSWLPEAPGVILVEWSVEEVYDKYL